MVFFWLTVSEGSAGGGVFGEQWEFMVEQEAHLMVARKWKRSICHSFIQGYSQDLKTSMKPYLMKIFKDIYHLSLMLSQGLDFEQLPMNILNM